MMTFCITPEKILLREDASRDGNDIDSYIEKMHKCSAAQWEKRLESKDRDYHWRNMNKSKAGVVQTFASSQAFEPIEFSPRRHRPVTKSKSCSAHITRSEQTADDSLQMLNNLQSNLKSKSVSYILHPRSVRLRDL